MSAASPLKVLLLNGSPHKNGCTHTALTTVAEELTSAGIEARIVHMGTKPITGCMACRKCMDTGYCVIEDDPVNEIVDLLKESDGFVVGSPVYFAAPNGTLCSLLDRVFYYKAGAYALKPAAAIVSCRRAGSTAALDQLHKYFMLASMPVVSSVYWNMVHGDTPDDVRQDAEGLQIMRMLGKNMAWLLQCIHASRDSVALPRTEKRIFTNFVR
jgi:multimeric flavodoxin WrbA